MQGLVVSMEPEPGNDTIRDRGQQMTSRAPAAKPSKLQHSRSRHQALQSQPCGLQHTDQRVTSAIGCGKRARTMISPFMEVAASHDIRDPPVSVDDSSTATVLGCTAAEQEGAARCRLSAVNSGMEECRSLPTGETLNNVGSSNLLRSVSCFGWANKILLASSG